MCVCTYVRTESLHVIPWNLGILDTHIYTHRCTYIIYKSIDLCTYVNRAAAGPCFEDVLYSVYVCIYVWRYMYTCMFPCIIKHEKTILYSLWSLFKFWCIYLYVCMCRINGCGNYGCMYVCSALCVHSDVGPLDHECMCIRIYIQYAYVYVASRAYVYMCSWPTTFSCSWKIQVLKISSEFFIEW